MSDDSNVDPQDNASGVDLEAPEVQEAIKAAVKEAKTGLDKKNKELLGKLKSAQDAAKAWDGLDPEEVHKILETVHSSEEAKLMAEGPEGIEKAFAKRAEKMVKAHEKALAAMQEQVDGEKAVSGRLKDRLAALEIDGKLTEALLGAGVNKEALPDGLARGRGVFRFDDEQNVRPLDSDGDPIFGPDGKSDLQMSEWATGLKDTAPHFFVSLANTGGGASGSAGSKAGKISRAAWDQMSQAERDKHAAEGNFPVD